MFQSVEYSFDRGSPPNVNPNPSPNTNCNNMAHVAARIKLFA